MATRLIIGLMSGTSVDAIDAALVRVAGGPTRVPARWDKLMAPLGGRYRARVLGHVARRWPAGVRGRLLAAMAPAATTTREICELNALVAREFAAAVGDLLAAEGMVAGRIDAVASHGQTICHLPPSPRQSKIENQKSKIHATLQLGDISVLAALTGIRTVGNFRAADMAVGGQGAPLVPWADAMMFSDAKVARCVQNIGGIANVTFLPVVSSQWSVVSGQSRRAGRGEGVIAFDTGPGNMLLDAVVRMVTKGREGFDREGRMAASGRLCERLLRRLQAHSYFAQVPPKSTGREVFGEVYARRLVESYENRKVPRPDLVHTLTRLTAWSIGDAYRRFLPGMPGEVILCGGGADNPVLVGMIGEELRPVRLRRIDELGIPNKAKEAASFALLAAATLDGIPANIPAATGAARLVILGEIADPRVRTCN